MAQAVGLQLVIVRWSIGNDISGYFFQLYFLPPLASVVTFSHRRNALIKKPIQQKSTGAPKNLGVDQFPGPVGHFGAPLQPFWIFEVLIEGMMESKNLFSKS